MGLPGCHPGYLMEFKAQLILVVLIRRCPYFISIKHPKDTCQTPLRRWDHQNKKGKKFNGAHNSKEGLHCDLIQVCVPQESGKLT